MDNQYLGRLPADVCQLVKTIEDHIGREIEVHVDPERARRLADQRDPIACEVDEDSACILISAPDNFPDSAVLHELIHIRRFAVEGVPKLVICEEAMNRDIERYFAFNEGIHGLDNNIEHLVIVPEELALRPERRGWWEPKFRRLLDQLSSGGFSGQAERDTAAFVAWTFIRRVLGNGNLREEAGKVLKSLGLFDRAENFYQEISNTTEQKEVVSRLWLQAIGLPQEDICFEYLDLHNGSTKQIPLVPVDATR